MDIFQDSYTWLILSFCLFAVILYRFGGAMIIQSLDKRIAQIKTDIETAESLRIEAQEMLAQYQRKQRDASKEAEKILKDAQEAAKKLHANAEEDLAEIIARREKQLEERLNRMQNDAKEEIRAYAAALSLQAVERLIAEKLDKGTNSTLVDQSIANIRTHIH
jgi:F-type H+-transporting ATPase subunit b